MGNDTSLEIPVKLTLLGKGVLLVCIPLCFEVTIFGVLINMQNHLEQEAQRINHNKRINDKVNLILRDSVLINNTLQLNHSQSLMGGFHTKDVQERVADIRQNFLELEDLARDDPVVLDSVHKCEIGLSLAFQDIQTLKDGLRTYTSIKDLRHLIGETRSHLEQHLYITLRGGIFELALISSHGTDEVLTQQIWGQIKLVLKCALALSGVLAVIGASLLSNYLVRRLGLVSQNAERLGKGQPLLPAFGGTDEVAELDRNFHKAAELIEAAKKMRQEVTAMITHDLKSPLQSVRSYLEMLEDGRLGTVNEPGSRLLATAQNAARQMGGLIDNVLQLEKLRSGVVRLETSAIELPRLLDKCLDSVKLLADQKQVVLERHYESKDCDTISGDAFWLEQVFVNILSNAIKFTANETTVTVSTQICSPGFVEILISDQGPGIAPQELKLIFDRFHRVQSTATTAGTGLGLPIAKELIELHHGAISVKSEQHKGSTFILRLPVGQSDLLIQPSKNLRGREESPSNDLTPQAAKDDQSVEDKRQFDTSRNEFTETSGEFAAEQSNDGGDGIRQFAFRPNGGRRKLGLLYKGLILISIPLCFEVVIFCSLMSLQDQVELEAQRISGLKKFNDDANVVMRDLVSLAMTMRKQKFRTFVENPQVYRSIAEMKQAFREEKQLSDNARVAQYVQDCEHGIDMIVAEIDRQRQQIHNGIYKNNESLEDLSTQVNDIFTTAALRLGNRSISPKYALRSSELRERSRLVLTYALGFSFLFAVIAAIIYQRNLVGRLNQVGGNADRLARGEPLLDPIGGTDEIAELDATVHYAAGLIETAKKMRQEATAMITHDLKTPLQSVRNYFEMLEMGNFGQLNEKGTRLLGIGQRSLQHMADLINSVLQLENLRTGNVTLQTASLKLATLLDSCLDSVKLLAGQKNISIVRGYDQADSSAIDGDAFWLEQVFANVLSNAIKFSPENSTIFVGLKKQDHALEVQVKDQGPGIPEKELAQIFDRYHRVQSTAAMPGTGLGLPIAKELIELHHGSIKAESTAGSGSTFVVILPCARDAGM